MKLSFETNSVHNDNQPNQQGDVFDTVGSISTNVTDGFTLVAVGDLIVSRAVTKGRDIGFGAVAEILRDADVTFGNLEINSFDIQSFAGSPQAEYGGAYHLSLPEVVPDLKAMGFNMVGRANNHTVDWGVEGMRETTRLLDQSGIVHAGAGENLAQAGAARFLETTRGRAALISFTSSFLPMARAGDPAGEAPGRPGVNPLRLAESIVIPPDALEDLKRIRSKIFSYDPISDDPNCVVLGGTTYRGGESAGYRYDPNPRDLADLLRNVRRGKQFSDFCIATNHVHEHGSRIEDPPNYEQSLAHQLIDAGADTYVAHGPHLLRGIEIYRGRPIFYGVGNFIQDDLGTPCGRDMFDEYGKDPRVDTDAEVKVAEMAAGFTDRVYYESIVTSSRFEQNQLSEVRLYPIELGHLQRFADRGIPRRAPAPQARAILERLQDLSKPYKTQIYIEDDIGIIRL